MSEHAAFLASVVENYADDDRRLIYADWLDEHDSPERATFIRLQIEAARLPNGRARAALETKASDISDKHGPTWLAGSGRTTIQ